MHIDLLKLSFASRIGLCAGVRRHCLSQPSLVLAAGDIVFRYFLSADNFLVFQGLTVFRPLYSPISSGSRNMFCFFLAQLPLPRTCGTRTLPGCVPSMCIIGFFFLFLFYSCAEYVCYFRHGMMIYVSRLGSGISFLAESRCRGRWSP